MLLRGASCICWTPATRRESDGDMSWLFGLTCVSGQLLVVICPMRSDCHCCVLTNWIGIHISSGSWDNQPYSSTALVVMTMVTLRVKSRSSFDSKRTTRSGTILAVLTLCCMPQVTLGQRTSDDELRVNVRSYSELNALIFSLFQGESPDVLETLKSLSDPSIALAAAWRGTRGEIERRYRQGVGEQSRKLFLSFVGRRLAVPVPREWASAILRATVSSQQIASCPKPDGTSPYRSVSMDLVSKGQDIKIRGRIRPGSAVISRKGNELTVSLKGHRCPLPLQVVKYLSCDYRQLSICESKHGVLYALHTSAWYPFDLIFVDRANARHSWKARVWAGGGELTMGGSDRGEYHWVSIVPKDEEVFVFGVSSVSIYVEAFRLSDGACTMRFGTLYGTFQ